MITDSVLAVKTMQFYIMRSIIFLVIVCIFSFQFLNAQPYSSCDAVIESISLPEKAPTDGTNYYACASGAVDIAYRQKKWPVGNQPDNLYVIEFSNLRPLETNTAGTWDTEFIGLVPGDTVFIRALTFDIDSINGLITEAQVLCPLLDAVYNYMPCMGINAIIAGENDGEPGVQTLQEVMAIAELVTNLKVRDFENTVQALKKFNNFISNLNAQVCFTYTEPPLMIFIEEDGPLCLQGDLDEDLIPNILEDINGNGNVKDDDTDGDGLPNYLDTDDNDDGILTADNDIDGDGDPTNDDANNDGIADYIFTPMVNINEALNIHQIYPNPNNGSFLISGFNWLKKGKIELYSINGQNADFSLTGDQLSITNPKKGVYFLKIDNSPFKVIVD